MTVIIILILLKGIISLSYILKLLLLPQLLTIAVLFFSFFNLNITFLQVCTIQILKPYIFILHTTIQLESHKHIWLNTGSQTKSIDNASLCDRLYNEDWQTDSEDCPREAEKLIVF